MECSSKSIWLEKFSKNKITPTENDMFFRKKLVHGTVHDPGAAMLGGVAGHAGLFSNANDLAKIFAILGAKNLAKQLAKIHCEHCFEK